MEKAKPPTDRPSFFAGVTRLPQHRTLQIALVGSLLMFLSLPPVGWWPLAWIAPVPWLWLARWKGKLPGRRPYGALWLAGFAFWGAANYWLCLPHWATSFGWFTLVCYHSFLPVMVVGLGRVAARKWNVGIVVSGPVIWIGFEQARAYLFTGFSMASLCHSQYRQTQVIQFADVCGEFGVEFFMIMVSAAIARALPTPDEPRWSWRGLPAGAAALGLLLGYGWFRLSSNEVSRTPGPKLALIQGSIDSEFKYDPSAPPTILNHYLEQSKKALAADPTVDLVVWPETMFPYPRTLIEPDAKLPDDFPLDLDELKRRAAIYRAELVNTIRELDKPVIFGISTSEFVAAGMRGYNSALYADAQGNALDRYDKRHLVIFGEYVPLAKRLPFLYKLTPLTGGTEEGAEAKAFDFNGVKLVPSICYETALARVIRRQVVELRGRGIEPDVLVNVTNDGWFWGSSELDLHLACGVYRAVETRKPLVVAANTGFSAHVDSDGRILAQGPRRDAGFINAAVTIDGRRSLYTAYGDWLCWICLGATIALAITGWRERKSSVA